MLSVPYSVLHIFIYLMATGGVEVGGGGKGGLLQTERYVGGGVHSRLSFFSLLYGTPANISRKPATRGMAS